MFTVTFIVSFLSSFAGPERNPAQAIAWQNKVQALNHMLQTGNTRDCEKILVFIYTKKADSEDLLQGHRKAKIEIEEGIRNDEVTLQSAPWGFRAVTQSSINTRKGTLAIIRDEEIRLNKLIAGRVREERAFTLLYQMAKAARRPQKGP